MRYVCTLAFVLAFPVLASAQTARVRKPLYDESADAHVDIAKAVDRGQGDHKRVLLIFGGNW